MNLEQLGPALLGGGAVVLLAVLGVRFAGRLGVPGLLLYLGMGLALGWALPTDEPIDPETAAAVGYAALVLILAHGGLTTRASELRPVLLPSIALATVGIAVSVAAVAVPLIMIFDLDTQSAVLLAAVLAATDAAAVFAVLRRTNVSARLKNLLEGESGFNDAPVVVLVTVIASGGLDSQPWLIPLLVIGELLGGAAVGIAIGFATRWLMPRVALPAVGLYPIAIVAALVMTYGVADFVHSSGFMAVYVAAILLGSAPNLPHRKAVIGFSDGLSWVAEIGLFVMLGLLAQPDRLPESVGIALVAAGVLVLFARPLAAVVALVPLRIPLREVGFVSFAGLRGAVPIVFAAIPLGLGVPGAEVVFDTTFIVVLVLTLVQSPAIPWVARRLKVDEPEQPDELDVDVAPLDDMDAIVIGLDVGEGSRLIGVFLRELALPEGAVVSLVLRHGGSLPPRMETRLKAGDRLVVVAPQSMRGDVLARLDEVSSYGRLGRWTASEPSEEE
ncbi:MAG: potassium/proton antiporter [Candidatus Nanopelagicales bacterium]